MFRGCVLLVGFPKRVGSQVKGGIRGVRAGDRAVRPTAIELLRRAIKCPMVPKPSSYHGIQCALERLDCFMRLRGDLPPEPKGLIATAMAAGFTPSEAVGIMDGWDAAFCSPAHWADGTEPAPGLGPLVVPEYQAGRTLGGDLAVAWRSQHTTVAMDV